jgi:protein O-mannosyl-transferase
VITACQQSSLTVKSKRPQRTANDSGAVPPDAQSRRPPPWWLHAAVVLGLLSLNLLLYHGTFDLGFLSVDDADYVQNNPFIDNFGAANLKRICTAPYAANYAPLNLFSYAVDGAIAGGRSATACHVSNVLWYGGVVITVYLLAYTLRARAGAAAAAALLFLLHPAHVEVVAWISSRKDLVATGFATLSMTGYLLCRRQTAARWWWYGVSVLCFLLAAAGKQSVLLLPAVMLLWDRLVDKRWTWTMLADKVPFLLIAAFFGWMTWHAQPGTNQASHPFVLAGTQFTNLWLLTGLGQYVLYRPAPDPAVWQLAARVAIILAAGACWGLPWLFVRTRQPVRAVLAYWVLIQMVPPMLLNFIVPVTDRYLFLPSVGVCILLADLIGPISLRKPASRWIGVVLLTVLAAVWTVKTRDYLAEWRDPRSVWYGAHLKTPSPQVAEFLGDVYQNAGDRQRDFIASGASLQVTNELKLAGAVLGNDTAMLERLQAEWLRRAPPRTDSIAYRDHLYDLAWAEYEKAIAGRGRLSTPNLFMARGRLLVSRGRYQQAIPEFETALAFAQTSNYDVVRHGTVTHALYAIGVAHWHLNQYKEAQRWLLLAQEVQVKSGQVWIPELDRQVERIKVLAAHEP